MVELYIVRATIPAVFNTWLVAAGSVKVLGVKLSGVDADLPFWVNALASWDTCLSLVATSLALVAESVAVILAWLSIVSDLMIAAHARVSKDLPSLVANSSRTICSTGGAFVLTGGVVGIQAFFTCYFVDVFDLNKGFAKIYLPFFPIRLAAFCCC